MIIVGIFYYFPQLSTIPQGTRNVGIQGQTLTPSMATQNTGMLSIQGTNIYTPTGQVLLLQGAMVDTSLAYMHQYIDQRKDPLLYLNQKTFQAMRSWNMNAIRINISQWVQQADTTKTYLTKVDSVISQANLSGLYVILDFHDDTQSGSPYGDGMLHKSSLAWWESIAARYKNNPMILFDPINEPKYATWNSWLQGDGNDIVGFQQIIQGIRSVGAQQIIVVEPGNAAKGGKAWIGFDSTKLTDQNILYSKHDYNKVATGNPQIWDEEWGSILHVHPIYYGEWALLPHPNHPSFCQGVTSGNADQVVNTFLSYLQSRHASWTAWDFKPGHLIQNITSYLPTNFQTGAPWTCNSPQAAQAGMGADIKQFLHQ